MGDEEGVLLGVSDGDPLGERLGDADGSSLGDLLGIADGDALGEPLGFTEGDWDGALEGADDGEGVGQTEDDGIIDSHLSETLMVVVVPDDFSVMLTESGSTNDGSHWKMASDSCSTKMVVESVMISVPPWRRKTH